MASGAGGEDAGGDSQRRRWVSESAVLAPELGVGLGQAMVLREATMAPKQGSDGGDLRVSG